MKPSVCTHGYFSPNQQVLAVEMALPLCKQRLHYVQPIRRWVSSALEMLSTLTDVFLKSKICMFIIWIIKCTEQIRRKHLWVNLGYKCSGTKVKYSCCVTHFYSLEKR